MSKIFGIGPGKFNSEVCVFHTGTGEIRFQRIGSDLYYIRQVVGGELLNHRASRAYYAVLCVPAVMVRFA